ncbi:MAG: hypothetical protein ACP5I6_06750 [Caldisphaera sp.]
MLFDPRPKTNRKDLYDFQDKLNLIKKYIGQHLIVVTGLRRTGKTSLILTSLSEHNSPYIFFDLRAIPKSRKELYRLISTGLTDFLSRTSKWEKFTKNFR